MQSTIIKDDLVKLHEFNPNDVTAFLKDKNDS